MSTDAGQQIARVHGRELVRGTEVSSAGERGRFRFIRATTTSTDRIVVVTAVADRRPMEFRYLMQPAVPDLPRRPCRT